MENSLNCEERIVVEHYAYTEWLLMDGLSDVKNPNNLKIDGMLVLFKPLNESKVITNEQIQELRHIVDEMGIKPSSVGIYFFNGSEIIDLSWSASEHLYISKEQYSEFVAEFEEFVKKLEVEGLKTDKAYIEFLPETCEEVKDVTEIHFCKEQFSRHGETSVFDDREEADERFQW